MYTCECVKLRMVVLIEATLVWFILVCVNTFIPMNSAVQVVTDTNDIQEYSGSAFRRHRGRIDEF